MCLSCVFFHDTLLKTRIRGGAPQQTPPVKAGERERGIRKVKRDLFPPTEWRQGLQIPDGLVVRSGTSHPGNFGYDSQTRGTRQTHSVVLTKIRGDCNSPCAPLRSMLFDAATARAARPKVERECCLLVLDSVTATPSLISTRSQPR